MATGDVTVNTSVLDSHRCAKFDGVDDSINLDSSIVLQSNRSISFWIKPKVYATNEHNGVMVASLNDFDSYLSTREESGSGNITSFNEDDAGASFGGGTAYLNVGQWNNIVISVNDSLTYSTYVNGVLTGTPEIQTTTTLKLIGASYGGDSNDGYLNGFLKDIRFYERSLTAAEALKLSQNKGISSDRLKHHWKLETDANDSISGNNGTVSGAAFVVDEQNVADAVSAARVTANDKYIISTIDKDKVVTTVIEES